MLTCQYPSDWLGVTAFEVPGRTWPEAGERPCPELAEWACPELAERSGTKVSSDAGSSPELVERPCPEPAEGLWLVVPALGGLVRTEITSSIASCNSAGVWGRSFGSFANILCSKSTTGTGKVPNSLQGGGFTEFATNNWTTEPVNGSLAKSRYHRVTPSEQISHR